MRITEIISEDDNGNVTNNGSWKIDQQKFFDQIGLTNRLQKDPAARLGYEIAKNPKTGVIDAIGDAGTYWDAKKGEGTAGEFTYNQIGSGTIKALDKMVGKVGQTPITRELSVGGIPPRTQNSQGYPTSPTSNLEMYGDVLAHELGHVGSLYAQGVPQADLTTMAPDQKKTISTAGANNEEQQRYRDLQYTAPGSSQYNQAVDWLANNKFNTPINDYSDYEDFGKQILDRGVPDHVNDAAKLSSDALNDPQKLQSYIQDYHGDKTNESLREHKMKINEIISEAANPAKQAAIAINMKKHGKKPKNETAVSEVAKKKGPKPTNPALWSRAKAAARAKYDVYPSAYANGYASKWYKEHGGGWRGK
jgi:hypothetical protein